MAGRGGFSSNTVGYQNTNGTANVDWSICLPSVSTRPSMPTVAVYAGTVDASENPIAVFDSNDGIAVIDMAKMNQLKIKPWLVGEASGSIQVYEKRWVDVNGRSLKGGVWLRTWLGTLTLTANATAVNSAIESGASAFWCGITVSDGSSSPPGMQVLGGAVTDDPRHVQLDVTGGRFIELVFSDGANALWTAI